MLAERLVVWMHYQLPHTSLNAGLWGGRGDGVYLRRWRKMTRYSTKVSISVIKYVENSSKNRMCILWSLPNSTSILRPSSNFLSTLFTQMGNEKKRGIYGSDVIGIYFLWELFTSFSLWLMLSLAAFELFLVLDEEPDFLRRFLSWKEFLMVNIREKQVESAKIFIERPRRLKRTYFTRYGVNQTRGPR